MTGHCVRHWWIVLLGLGAALAACTSPPESRPVEIVLPTVTSSPVLTVIAPTVTPLVLTRPPLPPTATQPTRTPSPTATPSPETINFERLTHEPAAVVVARHANCTPQIVRVRAVIRSAAPLQAAILNWTWQGRFSSRPGSGMGQVARADWVAELGPFDRAGTVVYWVAARDINGVEVLSPEGTFAVEECTAPSPTPTRPPGPRPTATPEYGEALSVHAADQEIYVAQDTPTTILLTWEGGVPPYMLDRVTQPDHGSLGGAGPVRVYIPEPGYTGQDRFTFRVLDGNQQASTGTITLLVGVAPPAGPTAAPVMTSTPAPSPTRTPEG